MTYNKPFQFIPPSLENALQSCILLKDRTWWTIFEPHDSSSEVTINALAGH